MRFELSLLKWVLIVLLLSVGALAAINAGDEDPAPEYQSVFAPTAMPALAAEKNAAFWLIGFSAPLLEDPYAKGVSAVQSAEKLAREKPTDAITQEAILGKASLAFQGDGSALCDFLQANCLAKARDNAPALDKLAVENSVLLGRYEQLARFDGARNPFPPRHINAPILFPDRTQRLKLSLIAKTAAGGEADKAMNELANDVAMLRRLLPGTQAVAERNLKVAALMRDVRLASELVRDVELSPSAVEALTRIVAPLSKDEMDYRAAASYESASYLSGFDVYRDRGNRGNVWYSALTGFAWNSVYKHQATLNRAARVVQAAAALTVSPAAELGERQRALNEAIRVETELNWRAPYNLWGKHLVDFNADQFEVRSPVPLYDLIGLMRLTSLQYRIKRDKLIDDRIRAYLETVGAEFSNPYTARPMFWNPADRSLGFDSGTGKAVVTVRVANSISAAAADAQKPKAPPPIPANILKQIQGGGVQ